MCRLPVTFLTTMLPYIRHAGPSGTLSLVLLNFPARPRLASRTIREAEKSLPAWSGLRPRGGLVSMSASGAGLDALYSLRSANVKVGLDDDASV